MANSRWWFLDGWRDLDPSVLRELKGCRLVGVCVPGLFAETDARGMNRFGDWPGWQNLIDAIRIDDTRRRDLLVLRFDRYPSRSDPLRPGLEMPRAYGAAMLRWEEAELLGLRIEVLLQQLVGSIGCRIVLVGEDISCRWLLSQQQPAAAILDTPLVGEEEARARTAWHKVPTLLHAGSPPLWEGGHRFGFPFKRSVMLGGELPARRRTGSWRSMVDAYTGGPRPYKRFAAWFREDWTGPVGMRFQGVRSTRETRRQVMVKRSSSGPSSGVLA